MVKKSPSNTREPPKVRSLVGKLRSHMQLGPYAWQLEACTLQTPCSQRKRRERLAQRQGLKHRASEPPFSSASLPFLDTNWSPSLPGQSRESAVILQWDSLLLPRVSFLIKPQAAFWETSYPSRITRVLPASATLPIPAPCGPSALASLTVTSVSSSPSLLLSFFFQGNWDVENPLYEDCWHLPHLPLGTGRREVKGLAKRRQRETKERQGRASEGS